MREQQEKVDKAPNPVMKTRFAGPLAEAKSVLAKASEARAAAAAAIDLRRSELMLD